jgi:hypothetical protein
MVRLVPLRDAAAVIAGFGRASFPSSVVGFLRVAFQPHLDQMQHTPVYDLVRYRFH